MQISSQPSTAAHQRHPCRLGMMAQSACMQMRTQPASGVTACTLEQPHARPAAAPVGYSLSVLRDDGENDNTAVISLPSGSLRERAGGRYLGSWGPPGPAPAQAGEPLQLPVPARRPFSCPPRRSSSGQLLLFRPLAKPRFYARFGERPMPGVQLADAVGLRVPRELRERAVLREVAGSQQQQHPGPPSALPWQEDPQLDLDELGDLVPEWACRLSRQQLLDHEAAETWRGLRAWRWAGATHTHTFSSFIFPS